MVDLKKLITGFLVLAVITSSLAFVLSDIFSPTTKPAETGRKTAQEEKQGGTNAPQIAASVFVEPIPEKQNLAYAAGAMGTMMAEEIKLPPITPTSNLTEALAQRLAREIIKANPGGPGGVSEENLLSPTEIENLISGFTETEAIKSLELPDWEKEASLLETKITDAYTTEDLAKYEEETNNIINKYFIQSGASDVLASKNAGSIGNIQLALENALDETKSVTAPKALADFHNSLLKFIFYEKNFASLAKNAGGDPVRASLVFKKQEGGHAITVENLKNEIIKLESSGQFSGTLPKAPSLFEKIFGIQKAHAFFFSIVFDPTIFGRMILEMSLETIFRMILQTLKNMVISMLQNQIVNWIEGGGNPKFITSWGDFFRGIANNVAGAAIEQVVPGLCQPFQPSIRINLNTSYGGTGLGSSCTLDRITSNIMNFYNDFSDGGWIAYGATLTTGGDYYLSQFASQQVVGERSKRAEDTARSKAVAGGGHLGGEYCEDGSTPQAGQCANGEEPLIRTPGRTGADALANALKSPIDLVTNANDPTGLLSAVLNAVINRFLR